MPLRKFLLFASGALSAFLCLSTTACEGDSEYESVEPGHGTECRGSVSCTQPGECAASWRCSDGKWEVSTPACAPSDSGPPTVFDGSASDAADGGG